MTKRYTRNNTKEFIQEYSFSDAEVERYKKSRRLEKIIEKTSKPILAIAVYSTAAYVILVLNHLSNEILNVGFTDYYNGINNNLVIIFGLIAVWTFVFLLVWIEDQLYNQATESGLDSESYSRYILAESYHDFSKKKYSCATKRLSIFGNNSHPEDSSIISIFNKLKDSLGITIDYHTNPIPQNKQHHIDEYIDRVYDTGEVDDKFAERTYEDFFALLIEEASGISHNRDIMFEIINENIEKHDKWNPESEQEENQAPSTYIGIFSEAVGSGPNIDQVWLGFIFIFIIGIIISQISSTAAIVIVTVFTSALALHERQSE